jgi:hypothetical protein
MCLTTVPIFVASPNSTAITIKEEPLNCRPAGLNVRITTFMKVVRNGDILTVKRLKEFTLYKTQEPGEG